MPILTTMFSSAHMNSSTFCNQPYPPQRQVDPAFALPSRTGVILTSDIPLPIRLDIYGRLSLDCLHYGRWRRGTCVMRRGTWNIRHANGEDEHGKQTRHRYESSSAATCQPSTLFLFSFSFCMTRISPFPVWFYNRSIPSH